MRLDKFIACSTELSRSLARKAIKDGRVSVNGSTQVRLNDSVETNDQICLDDQLLAAPAPRYLMLHKPAGVVSATTDSALPTVIDLLDLPKKEELQVVGRLDRDTTGLLLITDDGHWNHRVTSPAHECDKVYCVTTRYDINPATIERFAEGVMLDGEKHPTRPALLEIVEPRLGRLTISEGKYHQVKRMFSATRNRVDGLHRERVGAIALDPALAPGEYRSLTAAEANSIGQPAS